MNTQLHVILLSYQCYFRASADGHPPCVDKIWVNLWEYVYEGCWSHTSTWMSLLLFLKYWHLLLMAISGTLSYDLDLPKLTSPKDKQRSSKTPQDIIYLIWKKVPKKPKNREKEEGWRLENNCRKSLSVECAKKYTQRGLILQCNSHSGNLRPFPHLVE